jgi:hypothetical protein
MNRIRSRGGAALLAATAIVAMSSPAGAVPHKIETNKSFAGYEVAKT